MAIRKVCVAMSGGVDSAGAALLLRQQGYAVEGIILEFSPAHKAAVEQAKVVAEQLGIRLHIRECHREFEQNVILPFCREYKAGRTPNPCILCNPSTKFGLICQAAKEMGFDFIATGHYARIDHQADGTAVLQKSSCLERDQSYMLYRLSQEQLAMLLHEFDGNAFNTVVKFEFFGQAFLVGKCLGIFLQNNASWIGFCIYRMTDAIDEALTVKGFAVQNLGQIISDFIIILPVGNMFFDIFEHLLNLQIGTAVLWPFQGTEGGCDRRVSIGTCGSDNMGSESGVITTAVFCVDDQCDIKYLGFKLCILAVWTKQTENILSS